MTTAAPDGPPAPPSRRDVAVAGHTGDLVTALAGAASPDPAVRATAVGALARLGAADEPVLLAALADDDAGVRRRALTVAAREDLTPTVLAAVVRLLADPDPVVAETAAWACGELPPAPATVLAVERTALEHPEHLVREAAVAALGAIGDPAGLPAVLAALGGRATLRRRAVLALAAFEGPEVDAALRAALGDRDRQVRQAAEDLLEDRTGAG